MSMVSAIAATSRAVVMAAATGAATLGLLAVLHPFSSAPAATLTAPPATSTLRTRIDTLRSSLAETESALADVKNAVPPPASAAAAAEAQIATVTERRDLALRHAAAIRDALKIGAPLGSLAEIRDSVVIGQLLTQQAAIDAQIAAQGARLKAGHPVMLALAAQRTSLLSQIDAEAASIASALEGEAKMDSTQIDVLLAEKAPNVPTPAASADAAHLAAEASAQRTELDTLIDTYMNTPAAIASQPSDPLLSPVNLMVTAIAVIAAGLFQLLIASRRRRALAADLSSWQIDQDPEAGPQAEAEPPLRRAS